MNKNISKLLLALLILGFASCQKTQETIDGTVENMSDLKIPVGFTWENSTDIYFDITISDTRFGDALHVVSIYDADPGLNGKLLSKGSASVKAPFSTKLYLANTVKEVFIVKTAPDNSSSMQKVTVSGRKLSIQLSSVSNGTKNLLGLGDNKLLGLDDSPDCNHGCTISIATSNSNINVNAGDEICITGSNITVSFNANGGTIRICGQNVRVQNASLNNNSTLIITKTASVSFGNLNMNGSATTFMNYGNTSIDGSFSTGGSFVNENRISISSDFNLNSGSNYLNNGIMNVGSSMNVNTNNISTNSGSIIIARDFQLNNSSNFVNNCYIWVKANYNHNSGATLKNYNLVKVGQTTSINGSSGELGLYNGAMLSTLNLTLNNLIRGYGNTSLIKVSGTTIINSGRIENAISFCDLNGIETNNNARFTGGATQDCKLYIPVSNCNVEGNGTAPPSDSDGDGVMDALDEYPNDPSKAYNNYYPSSLPTSGATVAFEDQWPVKGDYDLNDVVVSYRYKIITNAQNKVVQVNGDYTLHATGSGYSTGFAVEFPTTFSSVSAVKGGLLESGQTNAVIRIFDRIRDEMLTWNTKPGETVSPLKSYSISFDVQNGPSLSAFGLGSYNPFIWNGGLGNGRNYEIHLPGKKPTSLGTTSVFGTGDDNSNVAAARFYVTATGLPWAIDIPIKPFNYPVEFVNITGGYLKFQSWAESGGTLFADWYSNTGSGYRNSSNLFLP